MIILEYRLSSRISFSKYIQYFYFQPLFFTILEWTFQKLFFTIIEYLLSKLFFTIIEHLSCKLLFTVIKHIFHKTKSLIKSWRKRKCIKQKFFCAVGRNQWRKNEDE